MPNMTHPDTLVTVLTVPQVAQHLGCSKTHVYRLVSTGALPSVDISTPGTRRSKLRIRMDDLSLYISSGGAGA